MFKINIIFILLSFISGCTSTYVHIINQGYSEKEVQAISQKLAALNIEVHRSDIAIPKHFPPTVITTNPSFSHLTLLHDIENVLADFNINRTEHYQLAQGRHFYNIGHIGLYLRNDNNKTPSMPPYLRTQLCKNADATLMFEQSGQYTLEYENLATNDEKIISLQGSYRYDGKQLSMEYEGQPIQRFAFEQQKKMTHIGERPADVYMPLVSSTLSVLNCEFLIIYMN